MEFKHGNGSNSKVIFKEKKLQLERHPATVQELHAFHQYRATLKEPVATFPPSFLPLVGKLIQDSDSPLNTLMNHVKTIICATEFAESNDIDVIPDHVLMIAIQSIAERINYGLHRDGHNPTNLAVWRWELHDKALLGPIRPIIESRLAVRLAANHDLNASFNALSEEIQNVYFQKPVKKGRNISTDLTSDGAAMTSVAPTSVEATPQKRVDPQKQLEREKKIQEKKEAKEIKESLKRKKEEERQKAQRSQLSLNSFVTVLKKEPQQLPVVECDVMMAFLERFQPFHVKKGVTVAKYNQFFRELEYRLPEHIPDEGSLRHEFATFRQMTSHRSCKSSRNSSAYDDCADTDVTRSRWKLLQFHEDFRPPYFGTWSKKSQILKGRRPFASDSTNLNYEVDSEAEWEEEEPGEELNSDEEEADDEMDEDGDEEDDFVVPDGVDENEDGRPKKKLPLRLVPTIYFKSWKGETVGTMDLSALTIFKMSGDITLPIDPFKTEPVAAPAASSKLRSLPLETLAVIVGIVNGSGSGMTKLVESLKERLPDISKAQLENAVREVATKERRPGDDKSKWHVRDGYMHHLTPGNTPVSSTKRKLGAE